MEIGQQRCIDELIYSLNHSLRVGAEAAWINVIICQRFSDRRE
jgi:hypothetical protein